jgi:hypothetical protein
MAQKGPNHSKFPTSTDINSLNLPLSDWIFYSHLIPSKKISSKHQVSYGSVSKPCTPGEHQNSW